jgi:putative ABC transport system ATP-binding protein
MAVFQRLNREAGITLILVTHESDIAAFANRTLHFRDGRLVRDERTERPSQALEIQQQLSAEHG